MSSGDPVARYFHEHADDFDAIYRAETNSPIRRWRDRLSRGTVVERLDFVLARAEEWHPQRVLDVGTGSGRFAIELAALGADVIGLDFAADMLAIARKLAAQRGVSERTSFLEVDFLSWDPPHEFDLSLAIGLFDYVSEPAPLLRRLAEATSGHVVASFPKLLHPLVPLRAARLRAAGCPVYFYTRPKVEALASSAFRTYRIESFKRDLLLVAEA